MDKNKKKNHVNGKYKKTNKTDNYRIDDDIETTCCFCFKTRKSKKKSLIAGCITNLGIFILLLAYTLLGAFIFLAIEGSAAKVHQKTLATTSYQANEKSVPLSKLNGTISQASAELRSQTVESIWEITVSLNILYKENWTRLAAQEISRFQEKLVARVAADVSAQYGARALESAPALVVDDYEWNFAKAFLYSLTVLTTIGMINFVLKKIVQYNQFLYQVHREVFCAKFKLITIFSVHRLRKCCPKNSNRQSCDHRVRCHWHSFNSALPLCSWSFVIKISSKRLQSRLMLLLMHQMWLLLPRRENYDQQRTQRKSEKTR